VLSQEERERALIARALIGDPRLLLIDEPTTRLDVAAREQLLETIDALGRSHPELASIMVTHHLEELPGGTTHAVLLSDGRAVSSGPVDTVLTTEDVAAATRGAGSLERDAPSTAYSTTTLERWTPTTTGVSKLCGSTSSACRCACTLSGRVCSLTPDRRQATATRAPGQASAARPSRRKVGGPG
jgi:ABC-type glutathione transport system ATPase component